MEIGKWKEGNFALKVIEIFFFKLVLISLCFLSNLCLEALESKTIVYKSNTIKLDKLAEIDLNNIIKRDSLIRTFNNLIEEEYSYFVIEKGDSVILGFVGHFNPNSSDKYARTLVFLNSKGESLKKKKNFSKNSFAYRLNNNIIFRQNLPDSMLYINQDFDLKEFDLFYPEFLKMNQILKRNKYSEIDIKSFLDYHLNTICDTQAYIYINDELLKLDFETEFINKINIDPLYEFLEKNDEGLGLSLEQAIGIIDDKIILIDIGKLYAHCYNINTKKVTSFWAQIIPNNFSVGALYRPEMDIGSFNYFLTKNNFYCIVEAKSKITLFRIDISNM